MGLLHAALAAASRRRSAPPAAVAVAPRRWSAAAARGRWPRRQPISAAGRQGIDRAWSSASARRRRAVLVGALKFRRLMPVADADGRPDPLARPRLICSAAPSSRSRAAPPRLRSRGFDPAGELAAALAARLGADLSPCLARRGLGHQVGHAPRRADRPPAADRADRRVAPQRPPGRRRPDHRRDPDLLRMALRGAGAKRVRRYAEAYDAWRPGGCSPTRVAGGRDGARREDDTTPATRTAGTAVTPVRSQ